MVFGAKLMDQHSSAARWKALEASSQVTKPRLKESISKLAMLSIAYIGQLASGEFWRGSQFDQYLKHCLGKWGHTEGTHAPQKPPMYDEMSEGARAFRGLGGTRLVEGKVPR